jgi:peptidoglycan/xylan/chitin deacetylase (PgdA/CDA1 family)
MRIFNLPTLAVLSCLISSIPAFSQNKPAKFTWPEGKRMAISLSFDDARTTNVRQGTDLFDKYGVKATFYVVPSRVKPDLELWKKAAKNGHEMGNHSIIHPCSGNFGWSHSDALEVYTLDRMKSELTEASRQIKDMLGVTPTTYAYPCGLTTLGRGANAQSFVPLIADMFVAGRGWLDEAPVDPTYCDMAQLTGMSMDDKGFDEILPLIERASQKGQWLVLAGHETADSGHQTTRIEMLEKLIKYAQDPKNGIWIAPVGTIAAYVKEKRDAGEVNTPQVLHAAPGKAINLEARYGLSRGPEIAYMPDWKAFGWFTGKDRVEWIVDVPQTATYNVILDWSVSNEEAGKKFILEGGEKPLTGVVEKSGSWETFKEKRIGTIRLSKGRHTLTFRPAEEFAKGALLDLRTIKLTP